MGKNKEIIDKVITACEDNAYTKDEAFNIALICCSSQMLDNGYSPEEALNKAIEFINSDKKPSETIYELLKLSGFKD